MSRTFSIFICLLIFLTGCWNNQEIDNVALVHGVGLDLDHSGEKIRLSVEIIKPTNQQEGGAQSGSQGHGQHIVIEKNADTLLDGARGLIRYAKRRLDFTHVRTWIISEELAKKEFVFALDNLRRDQMLRLNSYLFITSQDPSEILNTPTLYENITSVEIASALDQSRFVSEFSPIMLREFYTLIEEPPIHNTYVPMIKTEKVGENMITSIDGTAVIRDNQMVGKLDIKETTGLNWILNRVKGGSASVYLDEKERIAIEISKAKTTIKPHLKGKLLSVDIETMVEGTLSDNMTKKTINDSFFNEIETKINQHIENNMRSTLKKLQHDLKTDITDIGPITHRTFPKQWETLQHEWNDIFANAEVSIHVNTNLTHQGLINENIEPLRPKPYKNPYRFWK